MSLTYAGTAAAVPYEERSPAGRALYVGIAVIANVVPVVSTLYAPRCLPGYIPCKALWAFVSVIAAADQFVLSGGGDRVQTKGILYRGFAGDWFLTGRHTAGDLTPNPLPDPPPPPADSGGGWEPPPL
jgi:hypothetical protein